MAINRSLMERQLRMGGGIMNAMPRQQYGLGSFVKKAVKGVTGAVKSIAKSDVGKAALAAAAIKFGGPLAAKAFPGTFGPAATSPFLRSIGTGKFLGPTGILSAGKTALFGSNAIGPNVPEGLLSKFKFPGGGMGIATTVAGITGFLSAQGKNEEEIEEIKQNPEVLGGYLEQYYRNLNPPTADTNSEEYEAQVSDFVQRNLKADGGRIGYQDGTPKEGIETITPIKKPDNDVQYVRDTIKSLDGFAQLIAQKGNLDRKTFEGHMDLFSDFIQRKDIDAMPAYTYLQRRVQELNPEVAKMIVFDYSDKPQKANGGRIGFAGGTEFEEYLKGREKFNKQQNIEQLYKEFLENKRRQQVAEQKTMAANGGRIGFAFGNPEQNAMEASGIGGLPLNQNPAGITELDLRDSGGFIPPVGVKEKADDIPAMLSNNEFVFTADAVRGMGGGDVNVGAQRMYDMMKKLEGGGRV